jgi:hypothetical protein
MLGTPAFAENVRLSWNDASMSEHAARDGSSGSSHDGLFSIEEKLVSSMER